MSVRDLRSRGNVTVELEGLVVVDLLNPELTMKDIATKHNVSVSTVSRINKDYDDKGAKISNGD